MKNNKFFLILAGMAIFGEIAKILVSVDQGYYSIEQGWGAGLFVETLSVYILATSNVKRKWLYALLGGAAVLAYACVMAALSLTGIVYIP